MSPVSVIAHCTALGQFFRKGLVNLQYPLRFLRRHRAQLRGIDRLAHISAAGISNMGNGCIRDTEGRTAFFFENAKCPLHGPE